MSEANPKTNFFFQKSQRWQKELTYLRGIMLDSPLSEELKWGVPTYTLNGANIVLIHEFKEYCAILFVKGVLLADPKGLLIQQTPNVQSARQMRFTNLDEIEELDGTIRIYLKEAIAVEQAGMKVEMKKVSEYSVAEEFQTELDANPALKAAFGALTPGRQRAYLLSFSAPKQAKTRQARVEKYIPQILAGKGIDDV